MLLAWMAVTVIARPAGHGQQQARGAAPSNALGAGAAGVLLLWPLGAPSFSLGGLPDPLRGWCAPKAPRGR
eukprot:351079-Alexandrium_andersonii.AAC.1